MNGSNGFGVFLISNFCPGTKNAPNGFNRFLLLPLTSGLCTQSDKSGHKSLNKAYFKNDLKRDC